MGVDLRRENGDSLRVGNFTIWTYVLLLAQENGWVSQGCDRPTGVRAGEEWDRQDYTVNAGQIVKTSDALAFADALDRSLVISNRAEKEAAVANLMTTIWRRQFPDSGRQVAPLGLTNPPAEYLRGLIKFCRSGAFSIE